MRIPTAFLLLASLAAALGAEESPRTISVSGEAEVRVTPDEAVISVGVVSLNVDLAKARKDNDDRMARILKAPEVAAIDRQYIQTDFASIEPVWVEGKPGLPPVIGSYRVGKNLTIVLRDLSRLDALLAEILNAGANSLQGVEFRSSQLRRHRDEARNLAATAALEKARALAAVFGQKVLHPLSVNESAEAPWNNYRNVAQNAIAYNDMAGPGGGPTMAVGQIVVRASVGVVFELGD